MGREEKQLHHKRKKKRGEREGGQKEEDEAVYEQLLSLLAPGKRRKTRKPRRQRLPSADRPQPLPDQHELETDQHRPQAGVGETEEGEEGDGVRAEEVSGDKSEDGGEAEVSDGEEREAETGDVPSTVPFRRHFDHVLSSEEVAFLQSPSSPSPPSRCPPLGLVSLRAGLPAAELPRQPCSLSQLSIKPNLCQNWADGQSATQLSELQSHLAPILTSYQDLLFSQRTVENAGDLRRLYVLHILDHVLKTRSRVLKNNHKLLQASKEGLQMEEPRDQGLTRPKVLVLLPFRHSALQIVETLTSLLLPPGQGVMHNMRRFRREFGAEPQVQRVVPKPSSYTALFTGNTDDCFKLDIILASPLGLRTVIGAEGEKKRDFDFLSSVEVLVLDQADVFLMQNWEHVTHVLSHLHLRPREAHGVDFSRVRLWALNEWSHFYRQTIVLSALLTPEISSLFSTHCCNYAGGVRCDSEREEGSVGQVARQLPQMFVRLAPSLSPSQLPDHRLHHFSSQVLPGYHGDLMRGTLIFIPSYFDFVRIRNLMMKEELSFASISEYTSTSGVSRARTQFFQGLAHFLLYTERAHFFHRYRLRGVRHVLLYSLPTFPEHYSDLVNMAEGEGGTVEVLYSHWEQLALSRVVGGARAQRMIASSDSTHMIVTGHQQKRT